MQPKAQAERVFEFGKNWWHFLSVLNEERIAEAERALMEMLGLTDLHGHRFLDVGSGSGLMSLAAHRLGAQVHSFDYDEDSVRCTRELHERFGATGALWSVERGSVLDESYLPSLGTFDIVYAWGVLHHTGSLWHALDNVAALVSAQGKLFVSIYNDQGYVSTAWRQIKRTFNQLPRPLRKPFAVGVMLPVEAKAALRSCLTLNPGGYVRSWTDYHQQRGMSRFHDLIDWVGGYPFEVAKPDDVFAFYRERNFHLLKMRTCGGGAGCNEFIFRRDALTIT